MAIFKCTICGYIYDEAKEGKPFSELKACPICKQGPDKFIKLEENEEQAGKPESASGVPQRGGEKQELAYDEAFARRDPACRYMAEIHEMAVTGRSVSGSMSTQMKMPDWDDILILGAQLDPQPLNEEDSVNTRTIIGRHARKPMVLESPLYVSHMSFGALSKETKVALAKGSAMAGTATCSGEGGMLSEERAAAYRYIFEYVPNKYSAAKQNLMEADAIEIKIGQGTKPGMGGHLPGEKVTAEIAALRGKTQGEDIQSPSKFPEIKSKEDLKAMVDMLRSESEGRPIGIKIAAGRIEQDLECCVYAEPDFVTVDGRGGATGSSPFFLREASSIPTVYALYRARKYLNAMSSDIDLVITGGLRVSSDIVKALAMGADAVAVATAPLMAAACQQYRICGSGSCPMGIATQDPELRARLNEDEAASRVANYFNVTLDEIRMFARIAGKADIRDFSVDDLVTINREISEFTDIRHA